jgi:hypothetical protein
MAITAGVLCSCYGATYFVFSLIMATGLVSPNPGESVTGATTQGLITCLVGLIILRFCDNRGWL